MNEWDDPALAAELQALRVGFAARLSGRIAAIEDTWRVWVQSDDGTVLQTLHRLAHTLAGTAASYGYPDVGSRARRIELAAQMYLAGDSTLGQVRADIERLVEALTVTDYAAVC